MGVFVKVAGVNDLKDGEGKTVEAKGEQIALFKSKGGFFAVHNTCLHHEGPLGEGFLEENIVTCPWHGWQYDITNGKCQTTPDLAVKKYNVKIQGNDVMVEV